MIDQTIYLNSGDVIERQVFTAARELGHVQLHNHELRTNEQIGIVRRTPLAIVKNDDLAYEATFFAALLLIPEEAFIKHEHESNEWIAKVFVVPCEVVGFRRELGHVSE